MIALHHSRRRPSSPSRRARGKPPPRISKSRAGAGCWSTSSTEVSAMAALSFLGVPTWWTSILRPRQTIWPWLRRIRAFSRIACSALAQPREEGFDGLTLHQLRFVSQAKTGAPEAKVFERIAADESAPWPTRSWAWAAIARADGTKASRLNGSGTRGGQFQSSSGNCSYIKAPFPSAAVQGISPPRS